MDIGGSRLSLKKELREGTLDTHTLHSQVD